LSCARAYKIKAAPRVLRMDHSISDLLACCGFRERAYMAREVCSTLWFIDEEDGGRIKDSIACALARGGTSRLRCEQGLARLREDFCLLEDVCDSWHAGRVPHHVIQQLRLRIARRHVRTGCGTDLEDLLELLS